MRELRNLVLALLDELFTLPVGLDPELERAIEEFTAKKKQRESKMKDLNERAAAGGVKGLCECVFAPHTAR